MEKQDVKALAYMSIMRQIVVADTAYYFASEAYDDVPSKPIANLKERAFGFVSLMGTFMKRGDGRTTRQASITDAMEQITKEKKDKAIDSLVSVIEHSGGEHPRAAAHLYLMHALLQGANAAVDEACKLTNRGTAIELRKTKRVKLEKECKKVLETFTTSSAVEEKEIVDMTNAIIAYVDELLSAENIAQAITKTEGVK